MFPVNYCVNNIINLIYPAHWTLDNSKYYMYQAPYGPQPETMPDITICIPIYKEDFHKVIIPTLTSAIETRSAYTGKCNIVVLDDGYQFQDQELQALKMEYYNYQNLGMIARPQSPRVGKFKKASNLNNHLHYNWDINRNMIDYGVVHGDCSIGDYILLIDSDSRIDHQQINNMVHAISSDAKIGYIQFHTTPLDNSYVNFFSRQIAQFTKNLYDLVFVIVTSGGEPAPLVGHNAIIRSSVLREVARGKENQSSGLDLDWNLDLEWWNENKVSEDFDFAFRVQVRGYRGVYARFATFQEGISFDLHSELLKMSKFTYGALEMLTSIGYYKYLFSSKVPWAAKINISSYLFSYLALALSPILALLQLILSCYVEDLYNITLDPVILMASSFFIFSILGPISTYVFIRRMAKVQDREMPCTFLDQCKMGGFMFLFYTGSLFWFILGIVGTHSWGSTKKVQGKINTLSTYRIHFIATSIYLVAIILALSLVCFNWYGAIPPITIVIMHYIIPCLWRGSTDTSTRVELLV